MPDRCRALPGIPVKCKILNEYQHAKKKHFYRVLQEPDLVTLPLQGPDTPYPYPYPYPYSYPYPYP